MSPPWRRTSGRSRLSPTTSRLSPTTRRRPATRGGEWITGLAKAQAQFTRELASASPAAARELGKRFDEVTDAAARQARRVPGEPRAEGAVRGAAAREQDLPIANYDDLSVKEITSRLPKLAEVDLSTVEAYERKQKNRKTVLQ